MDEKLDAAGPVVLQRFWELLHNPANVPADFIPMESLVGGVADDYIVVSARTLTGEVVLVAVPRRQFLAGIGVGALAATTGPAGAIGSSAANVNYRAMASMFANSSVDHRAHFEKRRISLIDSDNLYGSAQTLPHLLDDLNLLQQLNAAGVGKKQEILRMMAMYAETAAWEFQDQRDFENAQYWSDRALRWSHQLADDYYIGLSLARMSQLAGDQGDGGGSIELADAAKRSAPQGTLYMAAILTFQAHGFALAGDHRRSDRAYDEARAMATQANSDQTWGMFVDIPYVDAFQAYSHAETGRYVSATDQFESVMRHIQPGYPRDKGVCMARAAVAYMAAGAIEPAAELGRAALGIGLGTGSARILHKVERLSGMIDRASTQPGVEEFFVEYSTWKAESCPDRT
ncbi:hypothetical protein [Nocardia acidivorans]|uniref:hypothetical protein n=1 Tax=Nocardia acidivorans TaxID=404580 RepID=UPI0012FC587E|nr:hypothetical protein [Nocardia acidivorans]